MVHATAKPIVPLLPFQKAELESDARFRWACWARQTGKSFTKSLRRVIRGIQRRRNQIFLSASERQSRELMLKARQHCQALDIATRMHNQPVLDGTQYQALSIELPNGVRILGMPANPDTVRGFTGDVFLDEFAMHAADRAIWAAVFPTILRGNGELDVASTPKGKNNVFYDLARNPSFQHSTVTLTDAVAQGLHIDPEEIRRSMGDDQLYRQEFLCEFIDEATAFLTYEQIAACEDPALEKDPPIESLAPYDDLRLGVDIGRKRDLTVLWVFECQGRSLITRAVYEHRDLPFRRQYELLRRLLELPNVHRCCLDAGGIGMQLAESAVEDYGHWRVEPVTFSVTLKADLAHRLRIAVEDRRVRIPVDEALRNDWHSVERSLSVTGQPRFDAARSDTGHADRFWAAALALRAAGDSAPDCHCLNVKPLSFACAGTW